MASTELADFFKALSHPLRQKILLFIAENDRVSSSELLSYLNCQTGTLYHHLKLLKDLIIQKEDRQYYLTAYGWKSVRIIDSGIEIQQSSEELTEEEKAVLKKINQSWANYLAPKQLFEMIVKDPIRHVAEMCLLLIIIGVLHSMAGLRLLFFFNDIQSDDILISCLFTISSWLCITGITLIVTLALYPTHRSQRGIVAIPVVSGIAMIPLGILPLVALCGIFILTGSTGQLALALVLQSWCVILLGRGVSSSFHLSWERGVLVAIITIYVCMVIYAVLSNSEIWGVFIPSTIIWVIYLSSSKL